MVCCTALDVKSFIQNLVLITYLEIKYSVISGYHDRKALYLMRGLSGSGKSTYARYVALITTFKMIINLPVGF